MVFARCSFECPSEVWKVNTQSKHNLQKKISKHLIEFRFPEFWMLSWPPKSNLLWGWCKLLRLRQHLSLCGWYGKHCLKGSCFLVQLHRWSCAVQRWKSRYPHAIRMISLYSGIDGIEIEGSAQYAKVWDHQRDQLWAPATDADSLWDSEWYPVTIQCTWAPEEFCMASRWRVEHPETHTSQLSNMFFLNGKCSERTSQIFQISKPV